MAIPSNGASRGPVVPGLFGLAMVDVQGRVILTCGSEVDVDARLEVRANGYCIRLDPVGNIRLQTAVPSLVGDGSSTTYTDTECDAAAIHLSHDQSPLPRRSETAGVRFPRANVTPTVSRFDDRWSFEEGSVPSINPWR